MSEKDTTVREKRIVNLEDSVLGALLVKSMLGFLPEAKDNQLIAPVGTYACGRDRVGALRISGPGLELQIAEGRVSELKKLAAYLMEHGDTLLFHPRSQRETILADLAGAHDVDVKLVKTIIAHGHLLTGGIRVA